MNKVIEFEFVFIKIIWASNKEKHAFGIMLKINELIKYTIQITEYQHNK